MTHSMLHSMSPIVLSESAIKRAYSKKKKENNIYLDKLMMRTFNKNTGSPLSKKGLSNETIQRMKTEYKKRTRRGGSKRRTKTNTKSK